MPTTPDSTRPLADADLPWLDVDGSPQHTVVDTSPRDVPNPALRPIAIIGPTASGKSGLSLRLARELDGEVVNVDSMQLYRGMDIGTAKLSVEERQGIPHHQLDIWEVTTPASVVGYRDGAIADIVDIMRRGKRPLIVGGSMMYIQALVDTWDFPPTDPEVRARWMERAERVGVPRLHAHLAAIDPEAGATIETNDLRRTVRALEVIELTGRPFAASMPPVGAAPRWGMDLLGLRAPTQWLSERIAQRTGMMFDAGFVEEVDGLRARGLRRESTAGKAIGYAQVLDYRAGVLTLDEAMERTTSGTRRYARGQRSWFQRDPRIRWIDATGADPAAQALDLLSASTD